jgi:hypothetical protein
MFNRRKTQSHSLRIFLAHSSEDKFAVRELYGRLRNEGFEPWLDEEDILPGQSWRREIERAIRDVDVIIVCLSQTALRQRGHLQREISFALDTAEEQPEGAVFLIPLKLEECEIPDRLVRWQWVNLFERNGYDRLIKALKLRANALSKSVITVGGLEKSVEVILEGLSTSTLATDHVKFSSYVADVLQEFSFLVGLGALRKQEYKGFATFSLDTGDVFEGLPFPTPVTVLASHDQEVTSATIERLHHLLIKSNVSAGSRIVLLIVFCDPETLSTARRRIARMFGDVYAYDVVIIGHRDLITIGAAKDPQRVLRSFILSQIDLTTVAPYTITGPTPDYFFFGREHELREVTEHAANVSYAIIGGRRVGKTSIVGRLHRSRLPAAGFRTIYHDCSTITSYDSLLTTPIRNWQPGPPPNAPKTFGDLIQYLPDDKPLVLLLDEVDKLVPLDRTAHWGLFNSLRSIANAGRGQVVLSGERTLRDALHDPTSPLFNFTNEILLGPLDYKAVEVLITQPMRQLEIELEDSKDIVNLIWSFTSGHPNIVQRLCRRLIKKLKKQTDRRITLEDVNAVIEDSDFQRKDFLETYWEAASHLEKIISLLMANDPSVITLGGVRQSLATHCALHPKAREVDDALQRLVDLRSILKRTLRGYEFAVGSFPKVVAGTVTLSDMLEILTEEYRERTP